MNHIHKRKFALYIGLPTFGMVIYLIMVLGVLQKAGIWIDYHILAAIDFVPTVILLIFAVIQDANRDMFDGVPDEILPVIYAGITIMAHLAGWLPVAYLINRYLDGRKKPKYLYFDNDNKI